MPGRSRTYTIRPSGGSPPPRFEHQEAAAPTPLIGAAPIHDLLRQLDEEIAMRLRRVGNAGLSAELTLLRSFREDLATAINMAVATPVVGSVREAAALIGRAESTVRRLCQLYGSEAGAAYQNGEWVIDLLTFERTILSGRPPAAHPHTTTDGRPPLRRVPDEEVE